MIDDLVEIPQLAQNVAQTSRRGQVPDGQIAAIDFRGYEGANRANEICVYNTVDGVQRGLDELAALANPEWFLAQGNKISA